MRRRAFLATGGACLAGLLPASGVRAADAAVEVRLIHDRATGLVAFDPAGLHVEPGTTVRWVNTGDVHTVTAYHPANGDRPLRIPADAEPWDSGYLTAPGATFSRRFTVPGVYDYFCRPHEAAGMAGRLVVGTGGAGARPFDEPAGDGRDPRPVPAAAREALPPVEAIVRNGRIAARRPS